MKMKEREVSEHFSKLSELGNMRLPSKLSFAISCNTEKLQGEVRRIEKERVKLCEQCADKDDEGKPIMVKSIINGKEVQQYKISDDNRKLFEEEYNAILDAEVDIQIRTVKPDVIDQCEMAERYDILTVAQLLALSFMIVE